MEKGNLKYITSVLCHVSLRSDAKIEIADAFEPAIQAAALSEGIARCATRNLRRVYTPSPMPLPVSDSTEVPKKQRQNLWISRVMAFTILMF